MLIAAAALVTIGFPATSFADLAGGCDFSPANNGVASCLGPLTPSTFAGGDGNLLTNPTTFGATDWQNVAGLNAGFDLTSGSGDNSFGQGTKEDSPNATVVTGSIPNNKSDLTRFYEASEFSSANNHNYLYLAWERANILGTANIDFEINHSATSGFTASTTGPVVLNRTAGDLLVTFDFTNGGGRPAIGLQRWLTGAHTPTVTGFSTNVCFSSNTFPCWGDQLTLDGTDSIGAVNNLDGVSDPLFPSKPNYLATVPALQFGETAIDLTKAGVFSSGTCSAFGSAFVKSRASASFTAEVKDFIAPIPVNISNCGTITIIKHTDPRGKNQVFSYTSNLPAESPGTVGGVQQGGVACSSGGSAGVQSNGNFCLNDSAGVDGTANTVSNNALQAGTYTVTEGAEPSGYTFESLNCSGGSTSKNGTTATINLAPGDNVVCTYVNQLNTAAMTTQESATSAVFPSQPVHDVATIVGNQAGDIPSGQVTFFLCGPISGGSGSCTSGGTQLAPTGTLSGTGAPGTASANSPDVNTPTSPLTPGFYCFRAEWPGDSNYPGALIGGADGTNECFTVQVIPTTTTTAPSSIGSNGTTAFGTTISDHAIVQATMSGDGTPTGTITFFVCDPTQVTGTPSTATCPAGTGTKFDTETAAAVAGSNPPASSADSTGVLVNKTGTWCFRAEYTPDTPNYTGSSDARHTECFTVTDTTASTSAQNWLPNDSATVTAGAGAPLNGTLSIQLYTDNACGQAGGHVVSGQLYTTTLTNATTAADRTVTSNNTTFFVTANNATTNVSWLVTFTSSDPNVTGSTTCEASSVTINN